MEACLNRLSVYHALGPHLRPPNLSTKHYNALPAALATIYMMNLVHLLSRMRAASGGRSGRMRMPVQENASTQIAARILADVKSHLSAEHASKAAARAQAERSSTPTCAFQGSLGQETPQVFPCWGCVQSRGWNKYGANYHCQSAIADHFVA